MKIYCPTVDFQGVRAGVGFVDGVGETDDANKIRWFRENGYFVPDVQTEPPKPEVKVDEESHIYEGVNLDLMTLEELKDFCKDIGKSRGVAIMKKREQVINHILKK